MEAIVLDAPATRQSREARAVALRIEGRGFVDGRYVSAASGRAFARVSPIHGRVVADVVDNAAADIDAAVVAARCAFAAGATCRRSRSG